MATPRRPFTGWHMTAILLAAFAVVLAVNLTMARLAGSTFGGAVVENSYVASQHFNRWLDEARASEALGWSATPTRAADGRIALRLGGAPTGAVVSGIARHPLGIEDDRALVFSPTADGLYTSREILSDGRWTLRLKVTADGKQWRSEAALP